MVERLHYATPLELLLFVLVDVAPGATSSAAVES